MDFLLVLVVAALAWLVLTLRNRVNAVEEELASVRANAVSATQVNEVMWRVWRLENPPTATAAAPVSEPEPQRQPAIEDPPAAAASAVHPVNEAVDEETPPQLPVFAATEPEFVPATPSPSFAERLQAMLGNQEWEMLVGGSL